MQPRTYAWTLGIVIFLCTAGTAQALWETDRGSDPRPRHCDPVEGPQESEPGLLFQDLPANPFSRMIGIWVQDANGTPWMNQTDRLLVRLESSDGNLTIRGTDFGLVHRVEIGGLWLYAEFMDIERTGTPQIMVPQSTQGGAVLFDIHGEIIRNYAPAPLIAGRTYTEDTGIFWPATGDFTDDGEAELVFASRDEWQAFRADGEMIARYTVIDPMDQARSARLGNTEGGRDYIYLATSNYQEDPEQTRTRLHKLLLQPNLTDLLLPYRFEHVWTRDFPGIPLPNELHAYDLTGNGKDEILLGFQFQAELTDGRPVVILDQGGEILYEHPDNHAGRIAIGDVDGDATEEVVVHHGPVASRSADEPWVGGSWITGVAWDDQAFQEVYRFQADDEFGGAHVTLCDMTGDGSDEILVGMERIWSEIGQEVAGEGKVKLLDGQGKTLWEFRMYYGQPTRMIIDDLTGDGAYEFIIGNLVGHNFVFSPSAPLTYEDYNQMFTAQADQGQISAFDAENMRIKLERDYGLEPSANESGGNTSVDSRWAGAPGLGATVILVLALLIHRVARTSREP